MGRFGGHTINAYGLLRGGHEAAMAEKVSFRDTALSRRWFLEGEPIRYRSFTADLKLFWIWAVLRRKIRHAKRTRRQAGDVAQLLPRNHRSAGGRVLVDRTLGIVLSASSDSFH
jgi:hypothetical protein